MKKWDTQEKDGITSGSYDFLSNIEDGVDEIQKQINIKRPIDKLKADSVQI